MAAPPQVVQSIAQLGGPRARPELIDKVWDRIETLEKTHDVHLTDVAKVLLILPVVERATVGLQDDVAQIDAALDTLFQTMKNEGADAVGLQATARGDRGSLAVIEAWAKNFCNIPPFCGRT